MNITKDELIDIMAEASHSLHLEIKNSYSNGTLNNYLTNIGMKDLIPKEEKPLQVNFILKISNIILTIG